MIGALATACFVKVYGAVFLGASRGDAAAHAQESPVWMLAPMGCLALICAVIGLAPGCVAPVLDRAIAAWTPQAGAGMGLAELAPFGWISAAGVTLLAMAGAMLLLQRLRVPRQACLPGITWDCGYALPTSRMQYTATSLAQMLVNLFQWLIRPRTHRPHLAGLFPKHASFVTHVNDPVLDAQILPAFRAARGWLAQVRWVQQGMAQRYVLYILIAVIVMLAWAVPIQDLLVRLFSR